MPATEPLTRLHAQRLWPRDAIKEFAFPQPSRAASKVVARHRDGYPGTEQRRHRSAPMLPPTLDISVIPELLLPKRRLRGGGERLDPLTVYPPDGRHIFKDTTFPWRACGRVTTNSGQGSGALVGPRHLLTASHVIGWTAQDAGWLVFQPDYYDGDVFPATNASTVFSYEQISPNDVGEYACAEDYVVCVLEERLGDQLGWFGTATYSGDWDGGNYWSHVGYADDTGGGTKPAWELWFDTLNSWHPGFFESGHGLDILTHASMNHGDSGGPVFGWWPDGGPYGGDSAGPYIVAVVSGEGQLSPVITNYSSADRTGNWLAGGSELPDLVNQARGEYP